MNPRTTTSGRAARSRFRTPTPARRPGVYLGMAAAGAVLVNVLIGVEPSAQAEATPSESLSVAAELGLSAQSGPIDVTEDIQPLEQLAASRSSRQAAETQAQQAQAAADQAELDRRKAEEEAKAKAAAEEEAKAKAAAEAAAAAAAAETATATATQSAQGSPAAAASTAASAIAKITNSAGPVSARVQAAANAVVSNVPGADRITLGGTRASAADPGGHPSGNALDYMVMSNSALGDAIVAYHRAHWDELGVDYIIWQQRMLSSANGSWRAMENRGSATANHMDHPHVNYR
ncbi:hypothetical protein GCU60_13785 [Blastococcus saxobsidens]|uniref:ARB-07466-like C-terminal domain-containing protein n=1 Tax=Blastococcus saxobsidens TaxID=138336 RepID=A0A6L9W476_9ACTN|nr:hypothetical protein [Blastococcus saxobsidens]NEK86813.1 hypothetical protein [Blastococcus saxobsidens]